METRNHWGKNVFIARSDDNKRGYPPGSPSESELQAYRDFAVRVPNASIGLVMGLTPGVREVIGPLTASVTLIDKSQDAIDFLSDAVPDPIRNKERIHLEDWENMPNVLNEKADIVMGDGVFANLLTDQSQITVLKAIKNVLSSNGRFITRNCVLPTELIPDGIDARTLINNYRDGIIDESEFGHAMRVLGLMASAYDRTSHLLDNKIVYALYAEWKEDNAITDAEFEIIMRYFFDGFHYYPLKRHWENLLNQAGFSFEVKELEGKIYNRYLPIYSCYI